MLFRRHPYRDEPIVWRWSLSGDSWRPPAGMIGHHILSQPGCVTCMAYDYLAGRRFRVVRIAGRDIVDRGAWTDAVVHS